MSKRKLWSAKYFLPSAELRRFESKAAVYRWIDGEVANWRCGSHRTSHVYVYVDERDGKGWQLYEHVDLAVL